jgi:hypothetical protein
MSQANDGPHQKKLGPLVVWRRPREAIRQHLDPKLLFPTYTYCQNQLPLQQRVGLLPVLGALNQLLTTISIE